MYNLLSKFQEQIKGNNIKKRWWLFHATDFHSLMYPCFTLGRILGILPFKINDLSFEISKPCYILSNIVACMFCFGVLIMIYIMNSSKWFDTNNEEDIIATNFFFITSSFVMITTVILNKPRMHLLQTIIKISSRLPSEMYKMPSILIHTKDICGFFFLSAEILYNDIQIQLPIVISALLLYTALLIFQIEMLYINCVYVLKVCFKIMNDDLTNLFINNESQLVKWVNHEQRNHLLMKLKALKTQHLIVSDTVQKLNIIFSPQILATVLLSFVSITFELYYNIEWKNGLSINWTKKFDHTFVIIDTIQYCIKIAIIAWVCETGKKQAVKISTTVHDMLNSTNDKKIARELQLFSLQIMHCDNTFSVKGLTLDATLITTMIGTVVTYLLILIQFLIMTHSCEEKASNNVTEAII